MKSRIPFSSIFLPVGVAFLAATGSAFTIPAFATESISALTMQISKDVHQSAGVMPNLQITPDSLIQANWLLADKFDKKDRHDDKKRRTRKGDRNDDRETRIDLQQAKNLARQAAEQANGGSRVYRAENLMYEPTVQSAYVDNGDSWTFTFLGGRPSVSVMTIESVVTVYKISRRIVVDYNGSIRNVSTTTTTSGNGGQSITLTNGYRVTFLGVTYASNASTWRYYVEELPSAQDLSNWVLGLPSCASVISASPKGELVNPDPNARISGIKWQPGGGFVQGEFAVTLNGRFAAGSIEIAVKGPDVSRAVLIGPSCNRI
jgi:hypothetical protein